MPLIPILQPGGSTPAYAPGVSAPSGSVTLPSGVTGANTLLGGIVNRFQGSTILRTAFTNGLWVGGEPEGHTGDFCVLSHQGEIPEWNSERECIETSVVQFAVFSVDADDCENLILKVKNRFDWGAGYDLAITGAATIAVDRLNYSLGMAELRNASAQVVHAGTLDYEFVLKRVPAFDTE